MTPFLASTSFMLQQSLQLYISYAVFQGVVLAIVIFRLPKGSQRANRYQGLWLLCLCLCLIDYLLKTTGLYNRYPNSIYLLSSFWSLSPVLFYFYLCELCGQRRGSSDWRHYLPFTLSWLYLLPFLILSQEQKLSIFTEHSGELLYDIHSWRNLLSMTYLVQGFVYLGLGLRLFTSNIKTSLNQTANDHLLHLLWVRQLLIIYGLYLLLEVLTGVLMGLGVNAGALVPLVLCICATLIHAVALAAVRQPEKLFPLAITTVKVEPMSFNNSAAISQRINTLLAQQQLYKQGDISVAMLATLLDMSSRQLSRFINQEMDSSFFDLINGYRVNDAKQQLSKLTQQQSILEIAMDVGFQSKSSFNRIFKKHTGQTPTAFIKSI